MLCTLYSKLENCTRTVQIMQLVTLLQLLAFYTSRSPVALGRDAALPPEVPPRQQLWERLFCLNCSLQLNNASGSLCMQFMCEVFKGRA